MKKHIIIRTDDLNHHKAKSICTKKIPKSCKSYKSNKIADISNIDVVSVKVDNLRPKYKNLLEWLECDDHIYIGRNMSYYVDGAHGSKWQNPFKVSKKKTGNKNYTLDESLELYENFVRNNSKMMDELYELDNKVLGCWCKPNRCHGDILVKLRAEQLMNE